MGTWDRCGNSSFWRWGGQGTDDYEQTFIDPVDLVMVRSNPENGEVVVSRTLIPKLTESMIEGTVNVVEEMEGKHFLVWIVGVLTAVEEREEFKPDLLKRFANASSTVRDNVLETIELLLAREMRALKTQERFVREDLSAVWEALGEFGIIEC